MNPDRYNRALENIPAPGTGCHTSLLSVANLGVLSGIDHEKIFQDIRGNIPPGDRRILDREILDAISKAEADHNGGTFVPRPRPKPIVDDGLSALQRIIAQGKFEDEADLWEASAIRLLDEPSQDPAFFLSTMFKPDDFVFIGEREGGKLGEDIRRVSEWIEYFREGGKTAPHIIVNPLNGKLAPKKSGDGETYRGDNNVSAYRYCLIEFDNLSRADQLKFWTSIRLPVVALVDSGGKSIHAWLDVQKLSSVTNVTQWESDIKRNLYDRIMTPMGVDGACGNPARLSRLPGHFREDKGKYQKLVWLSSEGREICK